MGVGDGRLVAFDGSKYRKSGEVLYRIACNRVPIVKWL